MIHVPDHMTMLVDGSERFGNITRRVNEESPVCFGKFGPSMRRAVQDVCVLEAIDSRQQNADKSPILSVQSIDRPSRYLEKWGGLELGHYRKLLLLRSVDCAVIDLRDHISATKDFENCALAAATEFFTDLYRSARCVEEHVAMLAAIALTRRASCGEGEGLVVVRPSQYLWRAKPVDHLRSEVTALARLLCC